GLRTPKTGLDMTWASLRRPLIISAIWLENHKFGGRGGGEHVTLGGAMAWGVIAGLASRLFAGAGVYINLVEHPAGGQCGMEVAVTQFGPSYHRATLLQVPLASTGFAAGAGAWISGGGLGWLVGGVVGVRANGPDGPREFPADLVIGTDGRYSTVRKRG